MPKLTALLLILVSTKAMAIDVDVDGMEDSWELANGLDPANPADALADPDGDALNNLGEHDALTNPNLKDTDGDWVNDGLELLIYGTDPNNVDTDGDGTYDFRELFIDEAGDGLSMRVEVDLNTDPDNLKWGRTDFYSATLKVSPGGHSE